MKTIVKIGRIAALTSILTLALSLLSISPASANKAGGACTKSGAKTTIKGDKYLCTKNPIVKKAKLTWVWVGCLDAATVYANAVKSQATLVASANKAITAIDLDIATLTAALPTNEAKAVVWDTKAANYKVKAASLTAQIPAKTAKADAYTVKATAAGATTANGILYTKAAASQMKAVSSLTLAASSYALGIKNAERTAANLRNGGVAIDKKKVQREQVNQNMENAKVDVATTKSGRTNACQPGL